MTTMETIKKYALLAALIVWAVFSCLMLAGEEPSTMGFITFAAVKLAAGASLYGCFKVIGWAERNRRLPDFWCDSLKAD